MSGDRDLLQAAAKAAGIEVVCWNDGGEPYSSGLGFILPSNRLWNPLDSDGDALRLAVKLDLLTIDSTYSYEPDEWRIDPYAATRRAIVRAAAAMAERPAQGAE